MAAKKADSGKRVRDAKSGQYIHRKDVDKSRRHVVVETEKKDTGGTESTGPRKEKK